MIRARHSDQKPPAFLPCRSSGASETACRRDRRIEWVSSSEHERDGAQEPNQTEGDGLDRHLAAEKDAVVAPGLHVVKEVGKSASVGIRKGFRTADRVTDQSG